MKVIDWDKPLQTRDGRKAVVHKAPGSFIGDGNSYYGYVVNVGEAFNGPYSWLEDGSRYANGVTTKLDLENVPEPKPRVRGWFVLWRYDNGEVAFASGRGAKTKAEALNADYIETESNKFLGVIQLDIEVPDQP